MPERQERLPNYEWRDNPRNWRSEKEWLFSEHYTRKRHTKVNGRSPGAAVVDELVFNKAPRPIARAPPQLKPAPIVYPNRAGYSGNKSYRYVTTGSCVFSTSTCLFPLFRYSIGLNPPLLFSPRPPLTLPHQPQRTRVLAGLLSSTRQG